MQYDNLKSMNLWGKYVEVFVRGAAIRGTLGAVPSQGSEHLVKLEAHDSDAVTGAYSSSFVVVDSIDAIREILSK